MNWQRAAKLIEGVREAIGHYPWQFCSHYQDDPPERSYVEFVEPSPLSVHQLYFSHGPIAPVRSPKTVKVLLGVCGGTPVNAGLYLPEEDPDEFFCWWIRNDVLIVEVPRDTLGLRK